MPPASPPSIKTGPFDLAATLGCGQVFHAFEKGPIREVLAGDELLVLEQRGPHLLVHRGTADTARRYLALDHPLETILETFPDDPYTREATRASRGLRIVRQPEWECLATFITSPMKQVAHIRAMSLEIRARFGRNIPGSQTKAYPPAGALAGLAETDLRACGLGFRAKSLLAAARAADSGKIDLQNMRSLPTEELVTELCRIPGVGRKVANCVALFAYGRLEAVPVDVWISRIASALRGRKAAPSTLESYSRKNFGPYAGYVQQYLFHHARTTGQLPEKKSPRKNRFLLPALLAFGLLGGPGNSPAQNAAARGLLEILADNPENTSALRLLMEKTPVGQDRQNALAELDRIASKNPLAYLPLGLARLDSGDRKGAAEALARVPRENLSPESLLDLARALIASGEPSRAAEILSTSSDIVASDPSLGLDIAAAFEQAGSRDQASAIFARIAKNAPPAERLAALESLARIAGASGNAAAEADATLCALDMIEPSHWKFRSALEAAIAAHPDPASRARLATAWEDAGARGDRRAAIWLAALQAANGDRSKEIFWLEQAQKNYPNSADLLSSLALARWRAGDPAAEDTLRLALSAGSKNQEVAETLAGILASEGDEASAADTLKKHIPSSRLPASLKKLHLRRALETHLLSLFSSQNPDSAFDLAEFYIEEGRVADADASFSKLSLPDPTLRAGTELRIAEFFRSAKRPSETEKWALLASADSPDSPDPQLLLADSAAEKGDLEAARAILEKASARWPENQDFDRRLLAVIQRAATHPAERQAAVDALAGKYALTAKLPGSDEASILRAARWLAWARKPEDAVALLDPAAEKFPDSIPIIEALAEARERAGYPDQALAALELLSHSTPPTPERCLRLARLETARGNPDAAAAILAAAAEKFPSDPSILSGLASANDAGGNHFSALENWIAAYRHAPPAGRTEYLPRILDDFRRLQLGDRAIDFLEEAAMQAPDGPARTAILKTAAKHCSSAGKSEEWEAACSDLLRSDPDSASLQAISPKPGTRASRQSLEEQLEKAAKSGDPKTAASLAKSLALAADSSPSDFARWAELAENSSGRREAGDILERGIARFPRDISLRTSAANFFAAAGDPKKASRHLRAASQLGPIPANALLALGRAEAIAGDPASALADFSTLLAKFPANPADASLPLPECLRSPNAETAQSCRELALEAAGRLSANAPDPKKILEQLAPANSEEAAWFHAGRHDARAALQTISSSEKNGWQKSVSATLADIGAWQLLGEWIAEEPDRRQTLFDEVFREMVENGFRPREKTFAIFAGGLPPASRVRAATSLASAGQLRLAAEIIPTDGMPPQLAGEAAFKLAGWLFALRKPEEAEKALERVIADGLPGNSLDDAWFAAVRAKWLVSQNRKSVADSAKARVSAAGTKRSGLLLDLLLSALAEGRAVEPARALCAEEIRVPDILREGAKLESWDLDLAARDLYRQAMDEDPALAALAGNQIPADMPLASFFQSRLPGSTPTEANYLISEWIARGAKPASLAAAATRALLWGNTATATEIARILVRMDPGNRQSWQLLLQCSPDAFREPHAFDPTTRKRIPEEIILACARVAIDRGISDPALMALLPESSRSPQTDALLARTALAAGEKPDAFWKQFSSLPPKDAMAIPAGDLIALADSARAETLLSTFLANNPKPAECLDFAEIAAANAERARSLGRPFFEPLFQKAEGQPQLANRLVECRLALARALGEENTFLAGLQERAEEGDPAASLSLLAAGNQTRLGALLDRFRSSTDLHPDDLLSAARALAKSGRFPEAASLYEMLDGDGISDPNVTLEFAEALWKSGRRPDALAIVVALEIPAAIDPALHFGLAKFFVSVNRPHAALREIDSPNLPPRVRNRIESLRPFATQK